MPAVGHQLALDLAATGLRIGDRVRFCDVCGRPDEGTVDRVFATGTIAVISGEQGERWSLIDAAGVERVE